MYHRNIADLPQLTQEIMYLDQLTLEQKVGIVMYVEQVNPELAFVYVASPYKEENIHEDFGVLYKDIFVFDTLPNEDQSGVYRDPVLGMYGKYTGEK
jgi:hypothetical protein